MRNPIGESTDQVPVSSVPVTSNPAVAPVTEASMTDAPVTGTAVTDTAAESLSERPTTIRYRVVTWLALAAALAYLCRNSIGVAESQIRTDLGLTIRQSGWVMGAFFWTYALCQVPTGSFSHRYGTRLALTLFAIGWSVAMLGTAAAPGFWILIVAQMVMGIAQAGIFPASTNSVNYWMPMSQRSLGCGLLAVGMQAGAIAASLLTGVLLGLIGWRAAFTLFAIPGLFWAIFFYVRFRDRPELSPKTNLAEQNLIAANRLMQQQEIIKEAAQKATNRETADTGQTDWGAMLTHRGLWLIYAQQICRAAGYMFFASWFPTFLQETRGVSISQSGLFQGVVFAGALMGGLCGGILSDWIWRRTGNLWLSRCGVGSFALAASGVMILGSWSIQEPLLAVGMLALGVLCASLAGPSMFAIVIDISGTRVPQVLGAVNMMGNLAVAVCPILIGELFERTHNWNLVLLIFAGIYFTGAICWALVDPQIKIFKTTKSP